MGCQAGRHGLLLTEFCLVEILYHAWLPLILLLVHIGYYIVEITQCVDSTLEEICHGSDYLSNSDTCLVYLPGVADAWCICIW
jgi:hypothetical protein